MYQRIVEPLIRSYGPFRVRQLILEMEGRAPRTLEVCRLTLADEPDQEVPLKTIHNSRIDLPWIVYAGEEYLDDLTSYMRQLDSERYENADPERLAEGLRRLSEVSDEQWAKLIARGYLTSHPRQRELMGIYHRRASEALDELRTSHPEGIPNVLEQIRAERPELDRVRGDAQHRLGFLRHEMELPRRFTTIWGEQVLQAGPFQVFEELGFYDRTDIRLAALQQRDDGIWVNATYHITFKGGPFGDIGIGMFINLSAPEVAQLCEPVRAWLAEKRAHQAWNREWRADYIRTVRLVDPEAYQALVEEEEENEQYQPDEEYQAVYNAWIALGCTDDIPDNPDSAFHPNKEALERAYPNGIEKLL